GTATATGWLALRRAPQGGRDPRVDLAADRLDLDPVGALARGGPGVAGPSGGAPAGTLSLDPTARELVAGQVLMADVAIDARFNGRTLAVERFHVGDLAGARLEITEGEITDFDTTPRGSLRASLDADSIDGVAQLLAGLFPDLAA